LEDQHGQTHLLKFAGILMWLKKQLGTNKVLPAYEPKEFQKDQLELLGKSKLEEITNVLHLLIESVTKKLKSLRNKLLQNHDRDSLLEVAMIIRNCREALFFTE